MKIAWGLTGLVLIGCAGAPPLSRTRAPASVDARVWNLECVPPLGLEQVFEFKPEHERVRLTMNESGEAHVAGLVKLGLRGARHVPRLESSVFLTGTRAADGRTYRLEGFSDGEKLTMELIDGGPGILVRAPASGSPNGLVRYQSRCREVGGGS